MEVKIEGSKYKRRKLRNLVFYFIYFSVNFEKLRIDNFNFENFKFKKKIQCFS